MGAENITDREFNQFQRFIYDAAGIALSPGKRALVSSILSSGEVALILDVAAMFSKIEDWKEQLAA